MNAIKLTGNTGQAWGLIEEGTPFEDNGGEPDGNVWLSVDVDNADADRLIAAGLAQRVEVKIAGHEAMARYCGLAWGADGEFEDSCEERDWVQDTLFPAVEEKTAGWAYYSKDSRFIFIER